VLYVPALLVLANGLDGAYPLEVANWNILIAALQGTSQVAGAREEKEGGHVRATTVFHSLAISNSLLVFVPIPRLTNEGVLTAPFQSVHEVKCA